MIIREGSQGCYSSLLWEVFVGKKYKHNRPINTVINWFYKSSHVISHQRAHHLNNIMSAARGLHSQSTRITSDHWFDIRVGHKF